MATQANPIKDKLWESWIECRISIPDHYAISHSQLEALLLSMKRCPDVSINIAGWSFEGRPIYAIEWGRGPIRVQEEMPGKVSMPDESDTCCKNSKWLSRIF